MKQTPAFLRLAARRLLLAVAVVALFITAWPAAAYELRVQTPEPPDPTDQHRARDHAPQQTS